MKYSTQEANYWTLFAAIILLAVGVQLRSLGLALDFWGDEAWWASRLDTESVSSLALRPIAYVWLCKQLGVLGENDLFYRLPSYIGGIGTLIFLFLSAQKLCINRFSALAILAFAVLHPKLIVFSKEFKPYSLETFIHCSILYWAILCYQKEKIPKLFTAICISSIFFCYNIVFIFPGVLWLTSSESIKKKSLSAINYFKKRRYFFATIVIATGSLLAAIHITFYHVFLKILDNRQFWGEKYDTFPIDKSLPEYIFWYINKTISLIIDPAQSSGLPNSSISIFSTIAIILYFIGVLRLIREKRHKILIVLTGTILCAALSNVLSLWPYGSFRTNLFTFPSILLMFGLGLDWLLANPATKRPTLIVTIMLLISIGATNIDSYKFKLIEYGAASPQLTDVIKHIKIRHKEDNAFVKNIILADWHSWRPLDYYFYHSRNKEQYLTGLEETALIRGPLNSQQDLLKIIHRTRQEYQAKNVSVRLWVVVTKLSKFKDIGNSTLFKNFVIAKNEFAVHDEDYHPVLYELHFYP